MEINRRNFIQLLAGGAAGIHMTPLPWKLMDDIAIWTQNNWPWVPKPEKGRFDHEKSVCTLCPGGCGIEVRKVGDRAVKIEGRTDYPVNPGGICPLGAGGLQLLYDETIRFTSPMKRVGPRGAGQFTAISWSEALATLAERIGMLRKEGRPEALAAVDGNRRGNAEGTLIRRLLESVGSPNYFRMPSIEDTYTTANLLMQGNPGPMAYDLENADYILSVGPALIEGWGAPGRVIAAWGRWHESSNGNGPKVVQVESRASNTASKSDGWVAPRPGTEAALALGLAHVMIREKLVDLSFLSNYTHGFEDWTDEEGRNRKGFRSMVLDGYAPAEVEGITGVSADRIVAIGREFGKAKSPLALYGKGKGNLNGSLLECMAVQSLNALKGNINKPGGAVVQEGLPVASWADVSPDAVAARGLETGRLNGSGSPRLPLSESLVENLSRAVLESNGTPPVDTLLVFAANPVYTLPDGGAFGKALGKIPFIVSFSPFRDETAAMADLILPDHTNLEKLEDVVWPTGLQYPFLGLSRPVVRPLYKTRHSGDAVIALAGKIGDPVAAAFPWGGFEEALKERLRGLAESPGLTSWDESKPAWETFARGRSVSPDYDSFDDLWDQLESSGFWYRPTHAFYTWLSCFRTPSGKFEFASGRLEQAVKAAAGGDAGDGLRKMGVEAVGDQAYMPHYEQTLSGDGEEGLKLVPYELFNVSTDRLPNPPFLTKTLFDTQLRKDESFVKMNPATADRLGLEQGERIRIQSDAGEVKARVDRFEGAMPGYLYLPMGFGHTAYGIYQKGKGVNPMNLVAAGKDPLSGQSVWWSARVRVSKA
ncbi:MAG: molybdopterin-dependent oxidoreductase [Deltaproteobacteria bacterium]|nr:molybdopterin-dependent oxidoreductase [Deltaproteobacteria bacterium]